MLVSRFTGATKRSFRPVRGNTPNHPITYLRPSQLSPVSTRPGSTLTRPCVPSQLVPGSTRPRVNSDQSQLVPELTRPESTRPRVNSSSSSQLVPGSTRPRVNSRLHLSQVNLHPCQLVPTSTRTRVIPQPSQLAPRSTRTQVPAYHTTHLPI